MTLKSGPAQYAQRLKEIVKSCGDKGFQENHLVFLDKNYPKDQIDKIISEIQGSLPFNIAGRFLYLIPDCNLDHSVLSTPMTASFML